MNSRNSKRGFTLIELMIVVAIIGILASIAVPSYQDYTIRAQVAEALVLVGELKPSIDEYYKEAGSFPADNESAGLPRTEHLIGQYVSGIEVSEGAMHIQFGNKAHAQIDGMALTVRPVFVTENPTSKISWNCGRSSLPNGMSAAGEDATDMLDQFLPSVCRS